MTKQNSKVGDGLDKATILQIILIKIVEQKQNFHLSTKLLQNNLIRKLTRYQNFRKAQRPPNLKTDRLFIKVELCFADDVSNDFHSKRLLTLVLEQACKLKACSLKSCGSKT